MSKIYPPTIGQKPVKNMSAGFTVNRIRSGGGFEIDWSALDLFMNARKDEIERVDELLAPRHFSLFGDPWKIERKYMTDFGRDFLRLMNIRRPKVLQWKVPPDLDTDTLDEIEKAFDRFFFHGVGSILHQIKVVF